MNIFVLDMDPDICAKYHCDQHVRKMILEYTAMLSYPYKLWGLECPLEGPQRFIYYEVSKWVRECSLNFAWLSELLLNLSLEFRWRFGKEHAYTERGIVTFFRENAPDVSRFKQSGHNNGYEMTKFHLAMPDKYKDKDPVQAYRNYYNSEKNFAKWTKRPIPTWYKKSSQETIQNSCGVGKGETNEH